MATDTKATDRTEGEDNRKWQYNRKASMSDGWRAKSGGPLVENTILVQGLHPALKTLGLPKSGMHAFRRGCNRRWELARVSAAVIRQQMGHASVSMTAHYTGEIPVEVVKNFLQLEPNGAAKAA